jgi:hypothetical protein
MRTAYKEYMSDEGLHPVPDDLSFGQTIQGFVPTQKLFGRYALNRMIGRGGMGLVWLAQDEKLDLWVALKFLPETLRLDTAALDDLKRETRRGLALAHPHIVRIYDFVDDDSAAAISMEYIDGRTLSALRIEQPTRVYEIAQLHVWTTQLVEALDYAHRRAKIVHRDLKPANLMTNLAGELKVADFGIARSISDSVSRVSVRGASSGTLVYMSPQQAQGRATKASDDIYALGATLYELLTSKPPFFSGNIQHQLDTIIPPTMAERRIELEIEGGDIPVEWEKTVAACLAKDPADRPQSVAQMGEWLGLRPPTTTSIPTTHTTTVKAKPQPSAQPSGKKGLIGMSLAAVAILLVLGGLGYYFGIAQPAEKARQEQIAKQEADADEQARLAAEKQKADAAAQQAAALLKAQQDAAAAEQARQAAAAQAAEQAKIEADKAAALLKAQQDAAAAEQARQAAAAQAAPVPPSLTPEQIAQENNQVHTQVQALIDDKKSGVALYHLQRLTASMDKDRAASISTPFQDALGPYQQQRDAAIASSQNGDPAAALDQLKSFDQQNPDDPKIEMAMATVATRMPPDHTALKNQLKQFKLLSAHDAVVAADPDFQALQTKFANELKQLDALSTQLDKLKSDPEERASLGRLEAERADAQKKLDGYQALGQTLNPFGMGAAANPSIADKQRVINSLDDRINAIKDQPPVSQSDIDDAQQKYDAFVAAVPW